MKILIATQNPGKFREITDAFGDTPFQLVSLNDISVPHEFRHVHEDGETFEDNARKKAEHFAKLTGLTTLGEDSGILVDAFPGELGVHTRRWGAGEKATSEQWISYFMERMKMVPPEKRTAKFVCVAAIAIPKKSTSDVVFFRGETSGVITGTLEALIQPGVAISSCFRPDGCDKVYAALSVAEKNRVSHRGKAIAQAKEFLINQKLLPEAEH